MKPIIFNIISFIIAILIIFIFLKFVLNKIDYFDKRKGIKNFIAGAFAIIIYFSVSLFYFNNITKTPKMDFDENLWTQNKEIRYQMIDDLVEKKLLIGKNKDEIKNIIGKPNKMFKNENKWVYELTGRTWSDFTVIILELNFESDEVVSLTKKENKLD